MEDKITTRQALAEKGKKASLWLQPNLAEAIRKFFFAPLAKAALEDDSVPPSKDGGNLKDGDHLKDGGNLKDGDHLKKVDNAGFLAGTQPQVSLKYRSSLLS